MTIFESWHSSRAFNRELELPLAAGLARVLAILLMAFLFLRFLDLEHRGALPLLRENRTETWLFGLEILLLAAPMLLLFQRHVRWNPSRLYACAVMVIFGFIANRLNVSVTGMEAGSGTHYIPKWSEVAVTLSIIALGFALFRLIAQRFPVFEQRRAAALVPARQPSIEHRVPAGVG